MRASSSLVIGPPGSGKSTLIKELLSNISSVHPTNTEVVIFTLEPKNMREFFKKSIVFQNVACHIHPVTHSTDTNIESTLRKLYSEQATKVRNNLDDRHRPSLILVFDDLTSYTLVRSRIFSNIVNNHRTFGIELIISVQCPGIFPIHIRVCFNAVYIAYYRTSHSQRRIIYDEWCSVVPTYEQFNRIFEEVTSRLGDWLLVYQTKRDRNDCISMYRTGHGQYKLQIVD